MVSGDLDRAQTDAPTNSVIPGKPPRGATRDPGGEGTLTLPAPGSRIASEIHRLFVSDASERRPVGGRPAGVLSGCVPFRGARRVGGRLSILHSTELIP